MEYTRNVAYRVIAERLHRLLVNHVSTVFVAGYGSYGRKIWHLLVIILLNLNMPEI